MNSLAESTLDAIELMYNSAVQNSKNSKTIECKVIEKIDAGIGLYRVSYLGNDNIEAYASNASINYEKDDIVYVLIPEGNDFSKTKIILGAASPSGNMYVSNEESEYITLSENLIYGNEVSLCTYHNQVFSIDLENFNNDVFLDYLNKYKNFLFSAKIRTSIPIEQQFPGNYGVILKLPIIKDSGDGTTTIDVWASFCIDVNNIKGNPYRLDTYSLQNLYLQIPEDFNYDKNRKPRLEYFVQGFVQNESVTTADIFIKDVSFTVQDIITSDSIGKYYLSLVATEGNYFLESSTSIKTIKPILKVSGKDSSVNGYDCYWFRENPKITYSDEGYTAEGGLGWECLNEKTDIETNDTGKTVFQYVLNSYSLDVDKEDVVSARKYKCVLVKNSVYISKELELKDFTSSYKMQLLSTADSNTFVENTGKVELIARLTGYKDTDAVSTVWKRFDKNGNYLDDITTYDIINKEVQIDGIIWLETRVSYPCSYIENSNLIRCAFYCDYIKDGVQTQKMAATDEILIKVSSVDNYRIVFENGDLLYKYDADGDSPRISDYDGPASSVVKEVKPIGFRMYKSNGIELTETEYAYCKVVWTVPINSMFNKVTNGLDPEKDYTEDSNNYYIKTKILRYDIRNSFDYRKANNQILLTVTFGEDVINQYVPITFVKDGASGTNGTKYSGLITYQNQPYGTYNDDEKLTKLQAVYIRTKGWYYLNVNTKGLDKWPSAGIQVGTNVYGDGEKLTSGYSVEWSMYDSKITKPLFTMNGDRVIVSTSYWTGPGTDGKIGTSNIIQAKITIANNTPDNSNDDVLYAYYPIEVTYISKGEFNPDQLENTLIPNLTGGFEQVLYSRDGLNPKFDSTEPFIFSTNLEDNIDLNILNYQWDYVGNLDIKSSNKGICKVNPLSMLGEGESLNYLQVRINYADGVYAQVQKDLYGDGTEENIGKKKELENCIKTVKDMGDLIDEISKETPVDNLGKLGYNIYINECLSKLNNCSTLVDYRSQMINLTMSNLRFLLDQVSAQCHTIEEKSSIKILSPMIIKNDESKTKIVNANNILFNLHNCATLNDIVDLESTRIVFNESDRSTCLSKYNVTSVAILDSYIEQYNNALTKYQNLYNLIKGLNIVNLNNYKDFISYCNNLTNSIFNTLLKDRKEFDNIINQSNDLIKNIYTCDYAHNPSIDYIKNNILEKIRNLLSPYLNKAYIEVFREQLKELQNQQKKLEDEVKTLEGILNSGRTDTFILHSKPIITMYNRYELGYLNDWDGSKLEISENEGYIVAPQIGAGAKNAANQFTGITMGVKKKGDTSEIGLFGMSDGAQSIFLNAKTGSATFGVSGKGQIVLDPRDNKARIYSSNYERTDITQGTCINLTEGQIHFKNATEGVIYSGVHSTRTNRKDGFYISHDGASFGDCIQINAIEGGSLLVGKVNGNKHWTINGDANNSYIRFGTRGTNNSVNISTNEITLGSRFYVNDLGALRVGNGAVANTGKHWTIDGNSESYIAYNTENSYFTTSGDEIVLTKKDATHLWAENNQVYIGTDGIRLGTRFAVDTSGNILAEGTIVAKKGKIGDWTIENGILTGIKETSSGHVYNVTLNAQGTLKATDSYTESGVAKEDTYWELTNKGGKIGGWTINKSTLTGEKGNNDSEKITINANGAITAPKWTLDRNGKATFSDIEINGGKLAITQKDKYSAKINNDGSAEFTKIDITGGDFNMANGQAHIDNDGNATFQSISITGGDISLSNDNGTLKYNDNGVDIEGKITATSGEIGGCSITNGILYVKNANIDGIINASHLDVASIQTTIVNTITTSSTFTFGGTVHATKIIIGAGSAYESNAFTKPLTINLFDSEGKYTGQATVLST